MRILLKSLSSFSFFKTSNGDFDMWLTGPGTERKLNEVHERQKMDDEDISMATFNEKRLQPCEK